MSADPQQRKWRVCRDCGTPFKPISNAFNSGQHYTRCRTCYLTFRDNENDREDAYVRRIAERRESHQTLGIGCYRRRRFNELH